MSLELLAEFLEVGKSYTFAEVFDLLGPQLTPEKALATYRRRASATQEKLPRDSQIISGRRRWVRQLLNTAKKYGYVKLEGNSRALQDTIELLPVKSPSGLGFGLIHLLPLLKKYEWVDLETLLGVVRPLVDEKALLSTAVGRISRAKKLPREQLIDRTLRHVIKNMMRSLAAQGRLETETVQRFRMRRFAKGEVTDDGKH